MFKDVYAPLPDAGAYLRRIGIMEENVLPTKENLDRIILSHVTHVPFENLDEYEDKACPELGVTALYDKIVTRHRGGYCFELNGALYALLKALGYEAYCVACRIRYGHDLIMPLSHRATIVTIDGERYFCDVGFGGPSARCAVPYDGTADGGFYIARSGLDAQLRRKTDTGDELIMTYTDYPFDPVDFIPLNYHVAVGPGSSFQMMPMINLSTENGSRTINGDVFRSHENGQTTELKLENDVLFKKVLRDEFGIIKE